MRIEAYNQVAALYQANKSTRTSAVTNVNAPRDQVHISSAGKDFQIAKQAVANASDIREDKVAELKNKVDSGSYQVDAGDFAGKLLEKYQELF